MDQQRHELSLEGTLPSGAEEWSCAICGRRTLIHWEPDFKRTVLEAGDDYAIHSASKGGLPIGSMQSDAADAPTPKDNAQPSDEDPRLIPWLIWLEQVDFESLWDNDAQ